MIGYLLGGGEGLEAGCLGDHGVAVAGAGLQRQGQARDGVDTQLRDGDLVVCDRERRLSQDRVHCQRGLHLRGEEVLLLFLHMTEGHRLSPE